MGLTKTSLRQKTFAPASLVSRLAKALAGKGRRLALAESCTGGLIAHLITEAPGTSEYFDGSCVVYSNRTKTELLGVPEKIFETNGAVSQACALSMLKGLFERTNIDLAAAVTGIAGPSGGSPEKPVGTVWIAWGTRETLNSKLFSFSGTRSDIKLHAAMTALERLAELAEDLK